MTKNPTPQAQPTTAPAPTDLPEAAEKGRELLQTALQNLLDQTQESAGSLLHRAVRAVRNGFPADRAEKAFDIAANALQEARATYLAAIAQPEARVKKATPSL